MIEEQISKEQSIKLAESGVWKEWDPHKLVRFQLFQKRLSVDFAAFHEALEAVLDRPVFTHEMGINYDGIVEEYLDVTNTSVPTFKELVEYIPEDVRIEQEK